MPLVDRNPDSTALLRRIDGYLNAVPRAASDVVSVGPFTLFFHRETDFPFLSYARPTGPLDSDLSEAIAGVRAAFAGRGRPCRWEFIQDLAPGLPDALREGGFPEPERYPLMVVTPAAFRPAPVAEAEVRLLRLEDDMMPVAAVAIRAFGMDQAPEELAVNIWAAMERGLRMAAAFVDDVPVAAGVHTPLDGVTELAGIGTLPEYRNRGLGGALSSFLVADAHAQGCECVFLTAGDDAARRLYARIGFQQVGTGMATMDRASST
jgi:ribosomal protein S18 acetylase RimI-like enzyme